MLLSTNKTLTLRGISGRKYVFNIYSYSAFTDLVYAFTPSPALYLFALLDSSNMCSMMYLGETDDLSLSFVNNKDTCNESKNANCVCICSFTGKDSRKMAEIDLLSAYSFPYNKNNT